MQLAFNCRKKIYRLYVAVCAALTKRAAPLTAGVLSAPGSGRLSRLTRAYELRCNITGNQKAVETFYLYQGGPHVVAAIWPCLY